MKQNLQNFHLSLTEGICVVVQHQIKAASRTVFQLPGRQTTGTHSAPRTVREIKLCDGAAQAPAQWQTAGLGRFLDDTPAWTTLDLREKYRATPISNLIFRC